MNDLIRTALFGATLMGIAATAHSTLCASSGGPSSAPTTVDAIVRQVEANELKYIFVGERHDVGPVKRFAVDLVNTLVGRGHDVGLYVEGFRTDCLPENEACADLAQLFNADAFSALLDESLAPVRPLDPPQRDRRAARMAATINEAPETLRVVLVGNSHVVHAGDPEAELWVYGGGMRFPNPGDLVEAFPVDKSLTVALEAGDTREATYSLHADGCRADYRLVAPYRSTY